MALEVPERNRSVTPGAWNWTYLVARGENDMKDDYNYQSPALLSGIRDCL